MPLRKVQFSVQKMLDTWLNLSREATKGYAAVTTNPKAALACHPGSHSDEAPLPMPN